MIELVVRQEGKENLTRRFNTTKVSIGRHTANDIVIPLTTVSAQHGLIFEEGGRWRYQDLKSSNGTVVERQDGSEIALTGRKRPVVDLGSGDRLIIDAAAIEFQILEEEAAEEGTGTHLAIMEKIGPDELDNVESMTWRNSGRTLKLLHKFMHRVSLAEDYHAVVQDLLKYSARLSGRENRTILVDVGDPLPRVLHAVDQKGRELPVDHIRISRAVVQAVIEHGEGLLFRDASHELDSDSAHDLQLRSIMAVPILDADRVGRVVIVDGGEEPALFLPSDLQMLMFFVYHASVALGQLRLIRQLNKAFLTSVKALVRSLDMRDPHTSAHCLKVQSISLEIARTMKLPEGRIEVIRYAALLHDVGKVAIPDEILRGNSKLTDEQRQIMSRHSEYTREILDLIDFPAELADVPLVAAAHHERMDGKGPLGIAGDAIPLEARILAVADVFDALTATRSYKPINGAAESMDRLRAMAGGHLDPAVVKALEEAISI